MKLNWTKREFETYVLLYAAHCNFIEDTKESEYILSKVDEHTFNRIHTEVVVDNETENIHKIQEYLKENLSEDIQNKKIADIILSSLSMQDEEVASTEDVQVF